MTLREWWRFRRLHRHALVLVDEVWIGPTLVGRHLRCSCGFDGSELTGAGYQQVGWWRECRGLSFDEGVARAWAGEDALGRWEGSVQYRVVS